MRHVIAFLAMSAALGAQPQRIVSTSPSITETLFALALGDRVVGVSQHCHYPPEADRRPRVGSYLKPNLEAIVGLRPDLVIFQERAAESSAQLERMKLGVLLLEDGGLDRMFAGLRAIASRCGVADRGVKLESEIRGRLSAIRRRTAGLPRRSLVFIVGRSPGALDNLIAVGKGSYLNELIEIAGGVNSLAGTLMPYPKLSLESMLSLNPDVLVDMGDDGGDGRSHRGAQARRCGTMGQTRYVEGSGGEARVCGGIGYFCGAGAQGSGGRGGVRTHAPSGERAVSAVFELHGAGMRYGAAEVLSGVDLRLPGGLLTAVVGPNGAGKSTLLGILAGLRPGYTGECRFDGLDVKRWNRRAFARRVSFVPQATRIEFPFTAEEVALMGRAPHAAGLFDSPHDRQAVHDAMELTGHAASAAARFPLAERRRAAARDPGGGARTVTRCAPAR